MNTIKFTVDCEMEERWVAHFMAVLEEMQYLGAVGSSRHVSLYADGDGDFRPKFNADIEFIKVEPVSNLDGNKTFDAG